MSLPKTFSGQLPLMQVNQQQPHDDPHRRPDPTKFRLSLHTFVDSRSYTLPTAGASSQSHASSHDGTPPVPRPAYKRIAFTTAQVPGQPALKHAGDSLDKMKRKKRRTTQNSDKARLRTMKPLSSSSDMHADAWSIILAHTRPAFVMQMRTVSKFFYHITNTDAIWREAREHYFNTDKAKMPPRPSFLTERQYASLLDGRGCQNPRCERRETRKVRWVFRLRLCDECLSRKLEIYKQDTSPTPQSRYASLFQTTNEREQFGTSIIDLLPTSGTWSGKPNTPRGVVKESGKWSARSSNVSPLLYLKSDYTALEEEWKQIQEEDWEPERVLRWTEEKYNNATMIARTAHELEWWEFSRSSDNVKSGSTRKHRHEYFVQKAAQLSPPMPEEVLTCFAAYHTSLSSSNLPSNRAWETLLAKILPYRAQAEGVVAYLTTRFSRFAPATPSLPEMAWFDQLHERRRIKRRETGRWSPEQRLVLDIAETEFNDIVDKVADEDLLLLCLHNVYKTYQHLPQKPRGLNYDGSFQEYRLSLDDAKLIVEEVIEKKIKKSTLRGVKVLESLRCMGCTRFTSGKRYSFQSAFEHMLEKHSRYVGKDLHFHRFLKYSKVPQECLSKDYKFPWYLVGWTRSLPLLPTHAEITSETRWDPDQDTKYMPMREHEIESAFTGKRALIQQETLPDDFVTNFVYAAETLSATRLDSECVVKIAIRYGMELYVSGSPSINDFFACIKPTQDLGSGLIFKFRCGACNRRPDVNSHLRCVKHAVDVNILRKHWDDKHAHELIDWSENFMDLPSDEALTEMMVAQDEKLEQDQANSIERETNGLKKNAKKVRDQKANALMQKEKAMEAFGRLFVKVTP